MDPNSIGAALVGAGIIVTTAWNGWQTVQAKREARAASSHAETAATNSKPVSNGFAKGVQDSLAEILAVATEARAEATAARELGEANRDAHTRHLEAHANGYTVAPVYPRAVDR